MSFDEIEHIAYTRIGHNQIKYAVAYYIKTRSPRVRFFTYCWLSICFLYLHLMIYASPQSNWRKSYDDTHSIFIERHTCIKWKSSHKNIIIGNIGINVEMWGVGAGETGEYKKRLYLVGRLLNWILYAFQRCFRLFW